jgi:hypothetical protein
MGSGVDSVTGRRNLPEEKQARKDPSLRDKLRKAVSSLPVLGRILRRSSKNGKRPSFRNKRRHGRYREPLPLRQPSLRSFLSNPLT